MEIREKKDRIDTNEMIDITDKVSLKAFIEPPGENNGYSKNIVLHVCIPEIEKNGAGLRLGKFISPIILNHFDEKGNLMEK